jgi:hypothetical protein
MNHKIIIVSLVFAITFWSCDDIFITNLDDLTVELVTPQDEFSTTTQTQTFFWEKLNEADEYYLRIVSPSFDNPTDVIADEVLTENSYSITLSAGTYQWRVIAANSSSQTQGEIRTLHILEDSTLNNQSINILTPNDNFITNQTSFNALWQPLSLADVYRIQLASPDFSHSSFVILDETTMNDSYSFENLTEGAYQWRIRAENTQSFSNYSTFNMTIDLTAPTAPTLVSPNDGDTLTTPISLNWTPASDAVQDTLYVYQDSISTTPYLQIGTTDVNYDFSTTDLGKFFWRLRSVDNAGNVSNYSSSNSFIIQ